MKSINEVDLVEVSIFYKSGEDERSNRSADKIKTVTLFYLIIWPPSLVFKLFYYTLNISSRSVRSNKNRPR